jgi:hypothetical protein
VTEAEQVMGIGRRVGRGRNATARSWSSQSSANLISDLMTRSSSSSELGLATAADKKGIEFAAAAADPYLDKVESINLGRREY